MERLSLAPIVQEAADGFRRAWPQLALTSIVYKIVALALLSPLAGLVLRLVVSTSGSSVVADEEILFFFLSPIGFAGMLVVAAVGLGLMALQQACLMAVAYGTAHGSTVSAGAAVTFVASRWRSVLSLTTRITALALATAAPFLLVAGGLYLALLTEFDINFYLSTNPPELRTAVVSIGSVLTLAALLLLYRTVGWLVALPTLLFDQVSAKEALRLAAERVRGRRREAAAMLLVWGASAFALSWLSTAIIAWLGRSASTWVMGSMGLLILTVSLILAFWFAFGQIVTFVNGAGFALLVTAFYRAGPGEEERSRGAGEVLARLGGAERQTVSRRAIAVALCVAAVGGLGVAAFTVYGMTGDSDAEITAHRGAAMWAPENTLASIQRALEDGTDWVEIDVQETADGRVVVVHDSDFMKLAGVPTKVWEATYDELQQIDIGSSFGPEFSDQRTPTLEQVLDTVGDRARVNIELKYYGHDVRLEERVVDVVEAAGAEDRVAVMSLKYEAVQKMRGLRPDWTLGLLSAVAIGDLTRVDADFLAVSTGLASRSLVKHAHDAGKRVLVWTVNDPLTAYAMISRGVDGIITDDPAMGLRVLAFYQELDGVQRLAVEVALLIGAIDLDDDEPEEIG